MRIIGSRMKIEHESRTGITESVPSREGQPNIDTLVRTIREGIEEKLSVEDEQGEGEELLPAEVRRFELNRQLLKSMEEQLPFLQEENRTVRINQLRGLLRLAEFLSDGGNQWNTGYMRQPTGAGKTVLYGITTRLLNTKTAIFVPKTILLTQTVDELVERVGISREDIGIIGGKHFDVGKGKRVLVGTYQTHLRRMGSDDDYTREMSECSVIICDEAHRSLGHQSAKSLSRLGLQSPAISMVPQFQQEGADSRLILAFTATTELQNKSVSEYYHQLISEEHYDELVDAGILVPFKIEKAEKSIIYEDEIRSIREEDEVAILTREGVYEKLIRAWIKARDEGTEPRYTAVFCANHKECRKYQELASRYGLKCQIVTGYEKQSDVAVVAKAEEALLRGQIDKIITVELLTEGWDFPPLNTAVMARATQSPARIIQPAGRTARAFDSTTDKRYAGRLHKPYTKTHALIIEADWSLRSRAVATADFDALPVEERRKLLRRAADEITGGSPPVDLAEALATFGEEAEKFVSRTDGQKVKHRRKIDMPDGRAEVYGEVVITLPAYARIPEKDISHAQLLKLVGEATVRGRIRSVQNLRSRGNRSLLLYREEDLDRIVNEWKAAKKQQEEAEEQRKELERGEVNILDPVTDEVTLKDEDQDRTAIGIRGILRLPAMQGKHAAELELRLWLSSNHVLPVKHRVLRSHPDPAYKGRLWRAMAYWKDVVLDKIAAFPADSYMLDAVTDEATIPEVQSRTAIGMRGILQLSGVQEKKSQEQDVRRWLAAEHVTPITGYRILRNNPSVIPPIEKARTYWKDLILSKLPTLPEAAAAGMMGRVIEDRDGSFIFEEYEKKREGIHRASSTSVFCKRWDIDPELLQTVARGLGIDPIPTSTLAQYEGMPALSEPIFWNDELHPLLSMVARNDQTIDLPSVGKEQHVNVRLAVTLDGFAAATGTEIKEVKARVEERKLLPICISHCVPFESAKITRKPLRERIEVAQTFIPELNQNWNLLCSGDDEETFILVHVGSAEEMENVYWADELEGL